MYKILLVEDIDDNAALVKRMLTAYGYEVHWANDAHTGYEMAVEVVPDFILLDLGLPDMDGQTLSCWLREVASLKSVPIIAYTAWPKEAALRMVEAYCLDGYLGKPVEMKTLLAKIKEYLP